MAQTNAEAVREEMKALAQGEHTALRLVMDAPSKKLKAVPAGEVKDTDTVLAEVEDMKLGSQD